MQRRGKKLQCSLCARARACARASDSLGGDELLEMPLLSGMMGAGPQEETPQPSAAASPGERPLLDGLQAQLGLQVEELTAQLEQREVAAAAAGQSGGREEEEEEEEIAALP